MNGIVIQIARKVVSNILVHPKKKLIDLISLIGNFQWEIIKYIKKSLMSFVELKK